MRTGVGVGRGGGGGVGGNTETKTVCQTVNKIQNSNHLHNVKHVVQSTKYKICE